MSNSNNDSNQTIRQIITILLLLAVTWVVVTRFANLREVVTTLVQGNLWWVLVSILLQVLYFFLDALMHKYSFATVGVKASVLGLFPVRLAEVFVNAVAPTGGMGGVALFVDYTTRHGQSGARTVIGMVMALISDLVTLLPFILWAVFFLYANDALHPILWVGVLIFTIFITILGVAMILARRNPQQLRKLMGWIQRIVRRIGHRFNRPGLLPEDWAERNSRELIEGVAAIVKHPKLLLITFFWGFMLHLVNLAILYMFFLAYDQPIDAGTLVAAFGLGLVFFVITIVPHGVGAVEGVTAFVMVSMGVPRAEAAVISLVYRGINFWLPLFAGFFFLRKVTLGQEKEAEEDDKRDS